MNKNTKDRIAVIGLGRAGLPLACTIAESGLNVIGIDKNPDVVKKLNKKINPIPEEPGVGEILKSTIGKNFRASVGYSDAKDCNCYIVIVPLFIKKDKTPDLSILQSAFKSLSSIIKRGNLVVLETTVPPGTTEKLAKILEKDSDLKMGSGFHLAYSPERIMTGYSISRFKEFPKIIGGYTAKCGKRAYKVYSKFCTRVSLVSDLETAELVKISEGLYRDTNIALANEIYKICDQFGVDFWELRRHANHTFCDIHEPGSVGGHCIPVYPWFLIKNEKLSTDLIGKARKLNDDMVDYYAEKIGKMISGGKVAIVGLTYREGVKENVNAQSFRMIKKLKDMGYEVFGLDPLYSPDEIRKEFGIEYVDIDDIESMDAIVSMLKIRRYRKRLTEIKRKVIDVKNTLS